MRKTYRIVTDIIAIDVVIQAVVDGVRHRRTVQVIDDGATLDKSVIEGWRTTPDLDGLHRPLHPRIDGTYLIPLLGIILSSSRSSPP